MIHPTWMIICLMGKEKNIRELIIAWGTTGSLLGALGHCDNEAATVSNSCTDGVSKNIPILLLSGINPTLVSASQEAWTLCSCSCPSAPLQQKSSTPTRVLIQTIP